MTKPIGIFDSGVGGLTVYKAIRAAFPSEDLIYFGDTARVPYGPKSHHTVIEYSVQNARFLLQKGIKALVVACNTASAVALPALRKLAEIPVIGVIEPGAQMAAQVSKNNKIGVIGTEGTIRSGAYTQAILALLPDAQVFSKACPLLVPLVEEGWLDHPVTSLVVNECLQEYKEKGIDTLVLGCTHYPLLKALFASEMGAGVSLVDSADAVAHHLKTILPPPETVRKGVDKFYVSDNEAKFHQLASRILGIEQLQLQRLRLFESWFE